jgi:hypothetical protein
VPRTYEDLAKLDPASLAPQQRGRLRALALTSANPETRRLARRILDGKPVPHEATARGAARAADYEQRPGAVNFEPSLPPNLNLHRD